MPRIMPKPSEKRFEGGGEPASPAAVEFGVRISTLETEMKPIRLAAAMAATGALVLGALTLSHTAPARCRRMPPRRRRRRRWPHRRRALRRFPISPRS